MIEGDMIKDESYIDKMKDASVLIKNEMVSTLHDKPRKEYMEKHKYEESVSEC